MTLARTRLFNAASPPDGDLRRRWLFFDYQFTKIPVPNPIAADIRTFYIDTIKRDRRTLQASFDYYRAIDCDIPADRARPARWPAQVR